MPDTYEIPALDKLEDAICDGGTPVAQCDFCKRTWFTESGDYMDDGELDRLNANLAAAPERYGIAPNGATSVSIGYFCGRQYVWGCRCELFRRIAQAVYLNLGTIAEWSKAIAAEKADEAKTAAAEAAALSFT